MLHNTIAAIAMTSLAGAASAADTSGPVTIPGAPPTTGPALAGDVTLAIGAYLYGGSAEWGMLDAGGRVNLPLAANRNLEIDVGGLGLLFPGGYGQVAYVDVTAHLWGWHTPSKAVGVFGGAVFSYGVINWLGGVEAKHFTSSGSWGVSAAVIRMCCSAAVGMFTASYNHYLNPNHRIGIRAGALTDFSYTAWEVAADIEHRFARPVSAFAEVAYLGGSGPSGYWTAKGGARLFLDDPADTLQSHETKVPWQLWTPADFGIPRASDVRLKRDIALVDRLPNGVGLYRYRYLWSDTVYVGVMAQDVAAIAPSAVIEGPDGYLRVDYAQLGLDLVTWDQWLAARTQTAATSG